MYVNFLDQLISAFFAPPRGFSSSPAGICYAPPIPADDTKIEEFFSNVLKAPGAPYFWREKILQIIGERLPLMTMMVKFPGISYLVRS